MGNVRNVSGEDRYPVELGGRLVMPGQVIEVADKAVYGYTCQDAWDPADEATTALAVEQEAANAEANPVEPEPERSQLADGPVGEPAPARSASRDDWLLWAFNEEKASLEELLTLGRDEIRDTYGPPAEDEQPVGDASDEDGPDQTEDDQLSADDNGDTTSQED